MKITEIHSEIQTSILDYFSIHPSASASAQGINSSWLANEKFPHQIEQVQTALDQLVEHGDLRKSGRKNIYSL